MQYECLKCKKVFFAKKRKGRKYCSLDCGRFGITGRPKKGNKVQCEICDKVLYRPPSRLNVRHFCSAVCRWQGLSGQASPNWKGGYSNYYGEDWNDIRLLVWKRDKYACQHCGKTDKELGKNPDVHHKIPVRLFYGDYDRANRLSNLIVLCRSCHQRLERNFSK